MKKIIKDYKEYKLVKQAKRRERTQPETRKERKQMWMKSYKSTRPAWVDKHTTRATKWFLHEIK